MASKEQYVNLLLNSCSLTLVTPILIIYDWEGGMLPFFRARSVRKKDVFGAESAFSEKNYDF